MVKTNLRPPFPVHGWEVLNLSSVGAVALLTCFAGSIKQTQLIHEKEKEKKKNARKKKEK